MADKYTPQDLQDNLNYLNETKNQIRQAIINKGQSVLEEDTFRSYVDKIDSIETGVDTSDATATADDLIAPKTAYVNGQKVTGTIASDSITINNQMASYTIPVTSSDCNSYMFALSFDREYLFEVSGTTIKIYKKESDGNNYSLILTKTASDLGITIGGYTFSVGAWGMYGDINKCLITIKNSSYNSACYGLIYDKNTNTIGTSNKINFGGYNAYGWAIAHPTIPDIVATNIGLYKYGKSSVTQIASLGNPSSYYIKQFSCDGTMFLRTSENKNQSNLYTFTEAGTLLKQTTVTGILVPNKSGNYAFFNSTLKAFSYNKSTGNYSYSDLDYTLTIDANSCIWLSDDIVATIINTKTVAENAYYTIKIYRLDYINGTKTLLYTTKGRQNHDASFRDLGSGNFDYGLITLSSTNILSVFYIANGESILTNLTYKGSNFYSPYDANALADNIEKGKIAYSIDGKVIGTLENSNAEYKINHVGNSITGDKEVHIFNMEISGTASTKRIVNQNQMISVELDESNIATLATVVGLFPEKLIEGNTVLNVTGTGQTGMMSEEEYNNSLLLADTILGSSFPYTYLDYVEFTGQQYIELPYNFSSAMSYEFTFQDTGTVQFGVYLGNYSENIQIQRDGTNRYYILHGLASKETDATYVSYSTSDKITILQDKDKLYFDGTLYAQLGTNTVFKSNSHLYLAVVNPSSDRANMRVYSFKIWDNNTLICDLVPVKRITDNEVGLYDKVNKVFYKSDTVNSLVPGGEL